MWQLRHPPAQQLAVKSKTSLGLAVALAAIALSSALFVADGTAAGEPPREGVLIVHSNQRPTPAQVIVDDTLRAVVSQQLKRPVNLFSEYLDVEWTSPQTYDLAQAGFFREKYGPRNIKVVVANALSALHFARSFATECYPACRWFIWAWQPTGRRT